MAVFHQLIAACQRRLAQVAGLRAVYRTAGRRLSITARPGQSRWTATDEYGATITVTSHDWLVAAADLVAAGSQITPTAGDTLEIHRGQHVDRYEVMRPPGEPCFRYSDPAGNEYRIYTKRTGTT
jgi:hypothetical protein